MSLHKTILPPESYYDPEQFNTERECVFSHAWLHVCHASKIPSPGDYITCTVAGQNIIVMRGHDTEIRAFYNVCQHRGTELLEGEGNKPAIVCRYHGWTYDTDGSLKHARGSEFLPDFKLADICLPRVTLEMMSGFVFVNLDADAASLASTYAGFEEDIRHYEPRLDDLVHVRTATFDLAVNWKIAVENYLESYHLRTVHPSFDNSLQDLALKCYDRHVSLLGKAKPQSEVNFFDQAEKQDQTNWWLWPMVMFEQLPGSSQVFTYNHIPLTPERTLQVVDFYFLSDTPTEEQQASMDYVEKVVRIGDKDSIEALQRGMHSRGWREGPLMISPEMPEDITERGVAHFQNIITTTLTQ